MKTLRIIFVLLMILLPVPGIAVADWHTETVDSTGLVGWDTPLALDSFGNPQISSHDSTNNDLKYAYHDGATWQIEIVDSTGDVGEYTYEEYLGHGKFFGAYKAGNHVFSFTLHNNLDFNDNNGAIEVGWSYARTRNLKAYLQYYNG